MPFLPISLMPILWTVVGVAFVAFAWWFIDKIGDIREFKVRTEFAEAARKKNVEIGAFNNADEIMAAIHEKAVMEAEIKAKGVAGQCPATAEQARTLTAIRRLK